MRGVLAPAIAFSLALTVPAPAATQSVEAGFRIGLTRSSFGADRVDERSALSFPALAGTLAFRVTPLLSIQPEVLGVLKGAARVGTSFGVAGPEGDTIWYHYHDRLGLLYLEVPVLARVTFPVRGRIRPYVAAGPYAAWLGPCFGYLVEAATVGGPGPAAADTVSVAAACLHGGLQHFDLGAIAAAGVRLPLGHGRSAVADVRYDFGARSVVTDPVTTVPNRTLSLSLGITFPLAGGASGP